MLLERIGGRGQSEWSWLVQVWENGRLDGGRASVSCPIFYSPLFLIVLLVELWRSLSLKMAYYPFFDVAVVVCSIRLQIVVVLEFQVVKPPYHKALSFCPSVTNVFILHGVPLCSWRPGNCFENLWLFILRGSSLFLSFLLWKVVQDQWGIRSFVSHCRCQPLWSDGRTTSHDSIPILIRSDPLALLPSRTFFQCPLSVNQNGILR